MKVLVTGSAGFIARSLIRRLLFDGNIVIGLDIIDTPKSLFDPAPTQFFVSYITDISDPKSIDPNYGAMDLWKDVDVCFHLAAMANVDEVRENREKAFQVNLHGTFNIVEACRQHNVPLIFSSTACVYGHTTQHPSTEDGETIPVDWYGVSKRAGEELIKGLLKRYVILRFGTTYGPEMREALCTHIFLTQAMWGKPFTIRGTGKQTRNWIYIDDLIEGCIRAMWLIEGTEPPINGTFNLVGNKNYSVLELAQTCSEIIADEIGIKDHEPIFEYLPERPDDVFIEDISNEKAKRLLLWEPQIDLEYGMRMIYEDWKKRGKAPKLDKIL